MKLRNFSAWITVQTTDASGKEHKRVFEVKAEITPLAPHCNWMIEATLWNDHTGSDFEDRQVRTQISEQLIAFMATNDPIAIDDVKIYW